MHSPSAISPQVRQAPRAADVARFEHELRVEAERIKRDDLKGRFLCYLPTGTFYIRRTGESLPKKIVRALVGDDGLAWIMRERGYRYRRTHPLGLVIFDNDPIPAVPR